MPDRFHTLLRQDVRTADACLILGTSLAVAPVSNIPDFVLGSAKRILLNRERVGNIRPNKAPHRDVFCAGDCDASITWLAKLLGWWPELQDVHEQLVYEMEQKAHSDDKKKKKSKEAAAAAAAASG